MNDELFVAILSTDKTASARLQAKREDIFWTVADNTAIKTRTTIEHFELIKRLAEAACNKSVIVFYRDNYVVKEYKFLGTDRDKLAVLKQFEHDVIDKYEAWVDDRCGSNNETDGFCWVGKECDGKEHSYVIAWDI
jgi:hypothetical protein